ncbi:MAG: aminotransferase class IV [Caulobacteraceae bacterium]|nr:aminotransferase class IV [Caulobacteraceae bacterium]
MQGAPLDDRGLLLGDGLFETLLWTEGRLVLGPEHASRMARGADVLGLPAPTLPEFLELAEKAVRAAGLSGARAAVRVTLTAGSGGRGLDRPEPARPRFFATAAETARPDRPARLAISSVRRNAASPASRLKTLAYLDNVLARREARAQGADEAVMLNGEGKLACTAAANLFWVRDQTLYTPPPAVGCLEGTMRAAVLAAAARLGIPVSLAQEDSAALAEAEAIFLTNSLIGLRLGVWAGGADPEPHMLVDRLAAAVRNLA